MCGIAGFVNKDQSPADVRVLRSMLAVMQHRGPDDSGTHTAGGVGLGHLRLSIIDLSAHGHQPFLTDDELGVLSYNGEVYNFRALRQELEAEGVRFRSTSDTEVVLYALHRWGPAKAVERFNGMFALAYYDLRSKTLWLARDRIGIKPLYWTDTVNSIVIASEIKGLLKHPAVRREPNIQALLAHVIFTKAEPEIVPFAGIHTVPPGSLLEIREGHISHRTYYDIRESIDVARLVRADRAPIPVAAVETSLAESVGLHLVSDAPLALLLSGGIESSLIAHFSRLHQSDLISYVAKVGESNAEVDRARIVAKHLGISLRTVDIQPQQYLETWPLTVWHGEYPTAMANDIPMFLLCQALHKDGVKVALSGEGADELFGGYASYAQTHRRRTILKYLRHLLPTSSGLRSGLGLFRDALHYNLQNEVHGRLRNFRDDWTLESALLCTMDGGKRFGRQTMLFSNLASISSWADRVFLTQCYEDLHGYLNYLLLRNDRMAMGSSLETRVPFVENSLIDHALHLSRRAKYSHGQTKHILKLIAEKHLPKETVRAHKIGFDVPWSMWQSAVPLLRNGLTPELLGWSRNHTQLLLKELEHSQEILFALLGVEMWAKVFLAQEAPETIALQMKQTLAGDIRRPSHTVPPPPPIKVLQLVDNLEVGGLERMVCYLCTDSPLLGIEPCLGCLSQLGALGQQVRYLNPWIGGLRPESPVLDSRVLFRLTQFIRRNRIQIIHSHNPKAHLYGAMASLFTALPHLQTVHGMGSTDPVIERTHRKLRRLQSLSTKLIVGVSKEVTHKLRMVDRLPPPKLRTILNGIDTIANQPSSSDKERLELRATLKLPLDSFIIGSLGRLAKEKNYPLMVAAFARFHTLQPNSTLVIVGNGLELQTLKDCVRDAKLEPFCILPGVQLDTPTWLKCFDVFSLSSDTEGTSMTILEAMATGLPVVATDVGGNREIVHPPECGLLVPARNPAALAEGYLRLLRNPQERLRMAAAARQRIVNDFSLHSMVHQYVALYNELLATKHR